MIVMSSVSGEPYPMNLFHDMRLDEKFAEHAASSEQCLEKVDFITRQFSHAQLRVFELHYRHRLTYSYIAKVKQCSEVVVARHCKKIVDMMLDYKDFIFSGMTIVWRSEEKHEYEKKRVDLKKYTRKIYKYKCKKGTHKKHKKSKHWVWRPELIDDSLKEKLYNRVSVSESENDNDDVITLTDCIKNVESEPVVIPNYEYECESEWISLMKLEQMLDSYPDIKAVYKKKQITHIMIFFGLPLCELKKYLNANDYECMDELISLQVGEFLTMDDAEIQKRFLITDSQLNEVKMSIILMIRNFLK